MKALIIIILAFTVFLLLPVGVDGGYGKDGLVLGVKIGPLNIKLFPRKKKERLVKPEKPKPPKKKSKKPVTEKEKLSLSQVLELAGMGLKALGRFRRSLRIDYFRLHCTFAAGDPFDTAMRCGAASAAFGAFIPLLERSLNIKERDFSIAPDFLGDKTELDIWLTATLHILDVFYIAIAFGIEYLKFTIKQKRAKSRIERNESDG